jgi:signal transduction histidine kinase
VIDPAPPEPVGQAEERLTRLIAYPRLFTAPFVLIPLFGWDRLSSPMIAVGVAVAAFGEAALFFGRARRRHTIQDPLLVWGDVAFCVVLMLVGSRAALPMDRNHLMTELVPFSLVAPAAVGVGLGLRTSSVAAVFTLMSAWTVSVLPDVTLKLASDLLGFGLWFVVSLLIARGMRGAAAAIKRAQDEAEENLKLAAEQRFRAEMAVHREAAYREIHDYLLPVVERVAAKGEITDAWANLADQGRRRARRLVGDHRLGTEPAPPFAAALDDLVDEFTEFGLTIESTLLVVVEPPARPADALLAAAREALRNVLKHARTDRPVQLFVEALHQDVTVVVHDHGTGFDQRATPAGGGLSTTFEALRPHGGSCKVTSEPGKGTKVTLRWQ